MPVAAKTASRKIVSLTVQEKEGGRSLEATAPSQVLLYRASKQSLDNERSDTERLPFYPKKLICTALLLSKKRVPALARVTTPRCGTRCILVTTKHSPPT